MGGVVLKLFQDCLGSAVTSKRSTTHILQEWLVIACLKFYQNQLLEHDGMLPTYNSHGKNDNTVIALALRQVQKKYTRLGRRLYRRYRLRFFLGVLGASVIFVVLMVHRYEQ